MKKSSKDTYKKLIKRIIKKSFPSLKGAKIKIEEKEMKISMKANRVFNNYILSINPIHKNRPEKAIIGCLAHELCHFEYFRERNCLQLLLHSIKYSLNKKYKTKVERGADMKTIKRGYGKELLFHRKLREKELGKKKFKRLTECYLSNKEIVNYINLKK